MATLTSQRDAEKEGKLNNNAAKKAAVDKNRARMKNTETQNPSRAKV
ncbi:hypothetical protein PG5_60890 [Pseudomonas sp. G5(2012)]|nr:hypothetical protein PG5_60890 [Pseudomonas sp. G5(2012)]